MGDGPVKAKRSGGRGKPPCPHAMHTTGRRSASTRRRRPAIPIAWHAPRTPPAARAIFTRDGRASWMDGEVFVQADYARTLERLAGHGPDEFYRGDLARAMATDIGRHGGFVTLEDLQGYGPHH